MVLAEMMNRGFYAAPIRRMRRLSRARQEAFRDALATTFGDRVPDREVRAGLHAILSFRRERADEALARRQRAQGMYCVALSRCHMRHDARDGLLLGIAAATDRRIREAVELLGRHVPETVGSGRAVGV
jgi:GntR family transcriptional regulator/MocR family aminotransferase